MKQWQGVNTWELLALLAALAVGAGLRFGGLAKRCISHFDEGVYVLAAAGVEYPGRQYFSPPLWPLTLEAAFTLLGPSDYSALLVSAAFGLATIVLVWLAARRWYGVGAGLFAVAVAAGSEPHATFSRAALTDVCFAFWSVLAVVLAAEAFWRIAATVSGKAAGSECSCGGEASGRPVAGATGSSDSKRKLRVAASWLTLAGLASGAALLTKYSGPVVLIAGLLGAWLTTSWLGVGWRPLVRITAAWLALAAVALLLYVPWIWSVGGLADYTAIVRHHSGYASRPANWVTNCYTLLCHQLWLTGWVSRLVWPVGLLAALVAERGLGGLVGLLTRAGVTDIIAVAMVAAVGIALGDSLAWSAGVILLWSIYRFGGVGLRFNLAWLLVLLVLTPLYRPYARLLVPLSVAGWLAVAGFIADVLSQMSAGTMGRRALSRLVGWSLGAALVLVAVSVAMNFRPPSWDSGSQPGLRAASRRLAGDLPAQSEVMAFIRPAVLYYMAGADLRLVSDLRFLSEWRGYLLVDSAILRDNPSEAERLSREAGSIETLARVAYRPSRITLLDDFGLAVWSEKLASRSSRLYELMLLRVGAKGRTPPETYFVRAKLNVRSAPHRSAPTELARRPAPSAD